MYKVSNTILSRCLCTGFRLAFVTYGNVNLSLFFNHFLYGRDQSGRPPRSWSQFFKKSRRPPRSRSRPDSIFVEILSPSRYLAHICSSRLTYKKRILVMLAEFKLGSFQLKAFALATWPIIAKSLKSFLSELENGLALQNKVPSANG